MYKVILYFSFAACYATKGEGSSKELLTFATLKEAENYGRSTGLVFEPVEIKTAPAA